MTDPYEGWLPRSHIAALKGLNETYIDQLRGAADTAAIQRPHLDRALLDGIVEDARRKLDVSTTLRDVNRKFGLSCWHINEDESEAMWRLYGTAGSGIAIESTEQKLRAALTAEGINIDRVRYMDFDHDEIEKGHKLYGLFIKRKSFVHEQELRATILLPTPGVGTLVPCDIDALVTQIHIAPEAPMFYVEAVRYIVDRANIGIKAPIRRSTLMDPPSY